jgi:arylsulfatase A-like enzyme
VQDEGRNKPGLYAKYPYDRALESMYADATVPSCGVKDVTPMPAFLYRTLNGTREAPDFSTKNYQEAMKDLYRLITGIDIAVGRILTALRERGLEDNTVIIYSADHGSFYGEHGFGGKWLMYEPALRTPMIVYDPRLPTSRRGVLQHEMVLNLDIPATLLAVAGVAGAPGMQGQSLMPLVRGEKTSWRGEMFYEHLFRDGPRGPDSPIAASEGVRTKRWKYVRYIDRVPVCEQLFDMQNDPREEHDLARDPGFASTMNEMRQRRENWLNGLKEWNAAQPWREPWALPS